MKKLHTIDEALDFAIERERDAFGLYRTLAQKATNGQSRDILLGFAAEEVSHRRKLEDVKRTGSPLPPLTGRPIFVVSNQRERQRIKPDFTFKEALVFAMDLEKKAVSLYLGLSQSTPDKSLKTFFKQLATEEGSHDERFEKIYKEAFGKQTKDSASSAKKGQITAPKIAPKVITPVTKTSDIIIEATSAPLTRPAL